MKKIAFIVMLAFLPHLAFADGTWVQTTPGQYSFQVPTYGTLTVQLWGGGGGGGNAMGGAANAGGASSFNGSVVAYGGSPGSGGPYYAGGGGGGAGGGDTNLSGGAGQPGGGWSCGGAGGSSPYGGAGGPETPTQPCTYGAARINVPPGGAPGGGGAGADAQVGCFSGCPPGAGGGGGAGYAAKTYASGALTPGTYITVFVGQGALQNPTALNDQNAGAIGVAGGAGGNGEVYISWTSPPAPTCSLTPSPATIPYGSSATIAYSESNATSFSISNYGPVTGSGTTLPVYPTTSTTYTGTVTGPGGSGTCSTVINVTPPPYPTVSISAAAPSIYVGQSTTITANFAAGSGDTLTGDNIDGDAANPSPWSGGLGATTNPDASKTITFTPTSAGTYTFYARATTQYYPSWTTYAQTSVTVAVPPPSCTFSASPSSITQGNSTSISWSCNNATSCSSPDFAMSSPNSNTTVSPNTTTTYTASCTGPSGTTNLSTTVTVSCAQSWSCTGNAIYQKNADCSTSYLTTCVSPGFCQNGMSSCQYPPPTFNPSGSLTGHLQVTPSLVAQGSNTTIHWNVSNVQSCTVTGTNGDGAGGTWNTLSGAQTSSAIYQQVTYTLSCTGYGGQNVKESQSVNVAPSYQEQ